MQKLLLRLSLVLIAAVPLLNAQADRAGITGTVSDPSGAVITGAKIEAKNVATGAVFEVGSSQTGNYLLGQLPVGKYELTVTVAGFKKSVRQDIELQAGLTARINVTLEVGANTEAITVTSEAALLKTETAEIGHNISIEKANNLPLLTLGGAVGLGNIRNPLQIVQLLPGASFTSDTMLRMNGLPANTQAIRIEGQDATNGIWKQQTQIAQSGLDAIQEVAILTSNYSAEFGQAGGGYINMVMKSGTNQYHGSAYDYAVNEFLNAGTPFTDAGATNSLKAGQHTRNRLRRNDFGFTLGGPVKLPKIYDGHDKTFFFFNFEQFRETTTTSNSVTTVPTAAYRGGDFTQANAGLPNVTWTGCPKDAGGSCLDPLGRIVPQNGLYDPKSTFFDAASGQTMRNLYAPFNIVPVTAFDSVAKKIQDTYIPQPKGPLASQLTSNYLIDPFQNFRHTTNPSIKLDQNLSSTKKISGYYSITKTFSPSENGIPEPITSKQTQDNFSHTIRISYDQTVTPTLLLHLGVGYLHTYNPTIFPTFDQSTLCSPNCPAGAKGLGFFADLFPTIGGINSGTKGGNGIALGPGASFARVLREEKPTAVASLTWVKGNHTYKIGGEMAIDGFPSQNFGYANGIYGFSPNQTGLPFENSVSGRSTTTGFAYASFLTGQVNSLQVSQASQTRLGQRAIGMYIQDTWKVTRKLTLDYGVRYDYQTYLKEQYGRMQSASLDTMNPTVNRLGAVIYEGDGPGRCKCQFGSNYPFAIGPRVGVAYQISSKTVFRGGVGLSYGTAAENAQLSYNVADFYTINAPGYGLSVFPNGIADGNPYRVNNPYGFAPVVWPNFDAGKYPFKTVSAAGVTLPPASPFIWIDRNAGRPPRILSWSVGLQREVSRDLVVEASYVGNRGVWFTAPSLENLSYNAQTTTFLMQRYGLDVVNSAADRSLLTTPMGNAQTGQVSAALIARGLGTLPYAGFPVTQTLIQALRPIPQWGFINPFLGPPLGATWYDSLQAKATKRYSRGLEFQAAFTWQKELSLGTNSSTSYFTPGAVAINDVENRNNNKQISSLSRPLQFVISGTYTVPRPRADKFAFKVLSYAVRDWQIGTVLQYQSGAIIATPSSNNGLKGQIGQTSLFFGGSTTFNRVDGQSPFLVDPNCHCFDPTRQLALNPQAWSDPAAGQWGVSTAYFGDYRWQRQPTESISLARNFPFARERRYNLQIRAEFTGNAFNRLRYPTPSSGNPASTTTCFGGVTCTGLTSGQPFSGGFGYASTVFGTNGARQGQLVGRFTF